MSIKIKTKTMFPALVTADSPITLEKSGLEYNFGFDAAAIAPTFDALYTPALFTQTGTGAVPYDYGQKVKQTFSVKDFGAKGDGTGSDHTAINAAIQAAYDYSQASGAINGTGASVYLPASLGHYRITSPIVMLRNVSLVGDGGRASVIESVNCNAISFAYTSGAGNPSIQGVMLVGTGASAARTAIKRTPVAPTNSDDAMVGLTIRDVAIEDFDTAIDLHTVQMVAIENIQVRRVNQGIVWRGFGGNGNISGAQILKLTGGGTGGTTFTGIDFAPVTYVSGSVTGTLGPEGVNISGSCLVNGFAIGINYQRGFWFSLKDTNVVATQYGVIVDNVGLGTFISDCYFEMQTTGALAAIWCKQQSAAPIGQTVIRSNMFYTNATTTTLTGVQVNSAGTFFQDNVVIENNTFGNSNVYDIAFYSPGGRNRIVGNRCLSTGTGSILVGTRQNGMTVVSGNVCASTITYSTASDLTNGYIRRADNVISATSFEAPSWTLQRSDAGQMPATTTNDAASAGNVGQYIEGILASGSATPLTTATAKTVISISLTAGDWDVGAVAYFAPAATTNMTFTQASISDVTNTIDVTTGRETATLFAPFVPGGSHQTQAVYSHRVSLSATTTYYLTVQANFTVAGMSAYGIIRARRVR